MMMMMNITIFEIVRSFTVDNLNLYWLGEQRSLNEYQEWAGVDFSRQSISESARSGLFNA